MRRAALMNTDDEGGEEEGSLGRGGSDDDSEAGAAEGVLARIEDVSDEEAREELREAQQRRLLEASQVRPGCLVRLCLSMPCWSSP